MQAGSFLHMLLTGHHEPKGSKAEVDAEQEFPDLITKLAASLQKLPGTLTDSSLRDKVCVCTCTCMGMGMSMRKHAPHGR